MLRKATGTILGALVTVMVWTGTAAAHVTVSPSSLPQGTGDAVLTFQVPDESTTAAVVGLQVTFPLDHPIAVISPEAASGWQVGVHDTRLAEPITTDDGTFTSAVSEIDWTGGSIPVGQFGAFSVLAQGIPKGTSSLAFATIQYYSDGSKASWIEVPNRSVPNPNHPAPILKLTAPGSASTPQASGSTAAAAPSTSTSSSDHGLAVASLILAALALSIAVLAVWLGRPPRPEPAGPEAEESAPRVDVGASHRG